MSRTKRANQCIACREQVATHGEYCEDCADEIYWSSMVDREGHCSECGRELDYCGTEPFPLMGQGDKDIMLALYECPHCGAMSDEEVPNQYASSVTRKV